MLPYLVNLGGEGEVPGILNQQGRWVLTRQWRSSATSLTFKQLVDGGHSFLICDNLDLPLPDGCCDEVITNNLPPFDSVTHWVPTSQTREVQRILKSGGQWFDNGVLRYVKP